MIVVVGVGDVRAMNIIQFDFKTVRLDASVVDAIEVVEGPVGCAGIR